MDVKAILWQMEALESELEALKSEQEAYGWLCQLGLGMKESVLAWLARGLVLTANQHRIACRRGGKRAEEE